MPAYFLVPVVGDGILEDRELRRAMAKASHREGWLLAGSVGEMSDEEIEQEIDEARKSRKLPKAG